MSDANKEEIIKQNDYVVSLVKAKIPRTESGAPAWTHLERKESHKALEEEAIINTYTAESIWDQN